MDPIESELKLLFIKKKEHTYSFIGKESLNFNNQGYHWKIKKERNTNNISIPSSIYLRI